MLPETFQPSRESPVFSFMILQTTPNLTNTYTCSTAVNVSEATREGFSMDSIDGCLGLLKLLSACTATSWFWGQRSLYLVVSGASARSPSLDVSSLSSHKDVKVASASKYMIDSLLYRMAQVNFSFTFGSMAIKKVKKHVNSQYWSMMSL
jgi:hypothetical protein